VGVVTEITESGKAKVHIPRGSEGVNLEGWQIIVKAEEVDEKDPMNLLKNEMRILNTPEALRLFGTPTPEGEITRTNKICLCSTNQLTEEGRKFIKQKFNDAVYGRAVAKVISVDKLGQTDLVALRLGDNEEFPFTIALEIMRDGDGKPELIRMLNEILPVEFLADFAKFLTKLAKEGKAKASLDCVCAGEKLERCVSQVVDKKVSEFVKENGKQPSTEQRKKMRSSAFAICKSQGLK
jgi:hypothetical protein